MRKKQHILWLGTLVLGIVLLVSCKKDKVPAPEPPPEPSKWEVIAGQYKVYDTLGTYLYDMNIVHVPNEAENQDSLRFENFDGEFTFTNMQTDFGGNPLYSFYVAIGVHNPVLDSLGNRWRIFSTNYIGYNFFNNDTIVLRFERSNLQYYIEDLIPYYECDCIQVAVKQ